MSRQINEAGLDLLKSREALRLTAYDDKRPQHVLQPGDEVLGRLTIGYGHTGLDVTIGLVWTQDQALAQLKKDVAWAEETVERHVSVPLTDNQFAALVVFTFNVGSGHFDGSHLLELINQQAPTDDIVTEWKKWDRSGGVVLAGLDARRKAEIDLFLTPDVAQAQ